MLFKPVLFVALAATVFAWEDKERTPVTMFTHEGLNGVRIACTGGDTYDRCYNIDNIDGASSLFYTNRDRAKEYISLTLYGGGNCNGQYDRWSFELPNRLAGFYVEKFHTLNDKVRSFKFHPALTSNVKGGFLGGNGETAYYGACYYDVGPDSMKSLPPLSRMVRG